MEIEPNPVKVLGVQIFWLTKTHILAPPSSSSLLASTVLDATTSDVSTTS